jgi:hypothetical protein
MAEERAHLLQRLERASTKGGEAQKLLEADLAQVCAFVCVCVSLSFPLSLSFSFSLSLFIFLFLSLSPSVCVCPLPPWHSY